MIDKDLLAHRAELSRYLRNGQYEVTDGGGILFPKASAIAHGVYVHDVNGLDERMDPNLLVTEGLNHILDAVFHGSTQIGTWYVSIFSGNVTPQATWTAANYVANATEIWANGESYTEATRPAFDEAAASAGSITNSASKAAFTIDTASSITVWGAALISSNVKGGTTGTLMSASKFAASRTLYDTDILNIGYTITLTST